MLTFFRRIRKGLFEDGSTSNPDSLVTTDQSLRRRLAGRYIIYAAGEILLVMIGILLALQVNNWNTNRIQNEKDALFF